MDALFNTNKTIVQLVSCLSTDFMDQVVALNRELGRHSACVSKGVLQTIAIAHSRIILKANSADKLATIWRHRYMTHNKGSVHCDDIHRLAAETCTNTILINADAGVRFLKASKDQNERVTHFFRLLGCSRSHLI